MFPLTNPVRDYAWGSHRRLADFLGRAGAGGPEAELWIGAHAGDPSRLSDGHRLDEVIAADPDGMLGERVSSEYDGRLPFLMKVLAVEQPLSLQVHPTAERARLGFAREERAGIPLTAGERSYKDPWHKPELIFALTRFEGMAGFRELDHTREILGMLDSTWADEVAALLDSPYQEQALRRVVEDLLALPPDEVQQILADVVSAARGAAERGHRRERVTSSRQPRDRATSTRREAIRVFELFPTLAGHYPDDPGVLVTLLLNHVVLAPGEALFVGAGLVHAYASGFGVEIMAASDNVLRAGLTPKHRDVAELLSVTDFSPTPSPRWEPASTGDVRTFTPPVADFRLTVGPAQGVSVTGDGPAVVLSLDGEVTITTTAGTVRLPRGGSAFASAGCRLTSLTGAGRIAVGQVSV